VRDHRLSLFSLCAALLLVACACGSRGAHAADPFPAEAPGTDVGVRLPRGFEPSGAVWHPRLRKLFVVDDGGVVAMIGPDGSEVRIWRVKGDLEAVCVADPAGDRIWLGIEHPDSIAEFDFVQGELLRIFDLTEWMRGPSNRGLEALTWVPGERGGPGRFHAGLQADGRIYVFELPTGPDDGSTRAVHVGTLTPQQGLRDLSGLHYDAAEQTLYAIFDRPNLLLALRVDGSPIASWFLPGKAQEGVTRDADLLFVADDDDGVMRYAGFDPLGPSPGAPSGVERGPR
jgi:hypothetical protein